MQSVHKWAVISAEFKMCITFTSDGAAACRLAGPTTQGTSYYTHTPIHYYYYLEIRIVSKLTTTTS
jgi:hypothetical protein